MITINQNEDEMTQVLDQPQTNTIDLSKYNGYITVKNPKTSGHRTFRIKTVKEGPLKDKRVIGLLVGQNNQLDYINFGFVIGRSVWVWRKHHGTSYHKMADVLNRSKYFAETHGLEYSFSVKCRVCNRDLTDPESIELGIGPVCRGENR